MKLSNKFLGWSLVVGLFLSLVSGFGNGPLVGLLIIVFPILIGISAYRLITNGK